MVMARRQRHWETCWALLQLLLLLLLVLLAAAAQPDRAQWQQSGAYLWQWWRELRQRRMVWGGECICMGVWGGVGMVGGGGGGTACVGSEGWWGSCARFKPCAFQDLIQRSCCALCKRQWHANPAPLLPLPLLPPQPVAGAALPVGDLRGVCQPPL